MGQKLTYEFVKEQFEKRGYELLEDEYKNKNSDLRFKCSKHPDKVQVTNWRKFRTARCNCRFCNSERISKQTKENAKNNPRVTFSKVKAKFEERGYTLVSTNYLGCDQALEYICLKHQNQIQQITWDSFRNGHGCKMCANESRRSSSKLTYPYIKTQFEQRGMILLSNEYICSSKKLEFICPHHPNVTQKITWTEFNRGKDCKFCGYQNGGNKRKKSYEDVRLEFEERGYELLEDEYIGAHTKMRYKCPYHPNEELYITYSKLQQGSGCKFCAGQGTSYPEQFIYLYLQNVFKHVINRDKLFEYEYDIHLPDYKIVIEYDGWLYHQNKENDKIKENIAINHGYRFIRIKEYDNIDLMQSPRLIENEICIYRKKDRKLKYMDEVVQLLFKHIHSICGVNCQFDAIKDIDQKIHQRLRTAVKQNSLAFLRPDVVIDWDYTKNIIDPYHVNVGSDVKVFWKCHKCGYEWRSAISARTAPNNPHGCHQCNGGVAKAVDMFDLSHNFLRAFNSIADANRFLGKKPNDGSIGQVCKDKQKYAYGYWWRYHNEAG